MTAQELRSRENMEKLGREYLRSAELLKGRIEQLKKGLDGMPLRERKQAELRIATLEQEMRDARRTGDEVGAFYLPGHRFLPRQKKSAVWPGMYIC